MARRFLEGGGDLRPLGRIGGNVHEPIGIEAISVIRLAIEAKLNTFGSHEPISRKRICSELQIALLDQDR